MSLFPPSLWKPLFDAVYEINTAKDHADFLSSVVTGMARLIPADLTLIHVLDRKTQRVVYRAHPENPFSAIEQAYYTTHPHEDPLVAHFEMTGGQEARRLSDLMSRKAYLENPFYLNTMKRLGFVHSLGLSVKVDAETVALLTFDRRQRDFTKRHCALLDAFAPHFRLAWQHHESPWRTASGTLPARVQLQKLGLTEREADVLFWMVEGKQNREIATILGRSLGTVQEHVANILRKLGQENRHAATVFALRHLGQG